MYQQHYENSFKCPICSNQTTPLLPIGSSFPVLTELNIIGAGNRLQKCHGCHSSDRDRLVYLYLIEKELLFQKQTKGYTILHVAPEDCIAKIMLQNKWLNYIPIDSFEHGYNYPTYIRQMDLFELKLDDASVDMVICNHVLQDVSDDEAALREIYRVLKPKGHSILQVPISPILSDNLESDVVLTLDECQKKYGQRFHKRIYSHKGYMHRLKNVGFNVIVENLPETTTINCSINPAERLYIAIK